MGGLHDSLAQLARHGYLVLFAWVAAEQLGAPLPAVPVLIAAGVLSATGQLTLTMALLLGVVACLIGDTVWYAIGKRKGTAVLRLLCKITLEPETCVRRSSEFIARHGSRSLVFAKFIPGISTVAVPLAANSGTSLPSFLLYDSLGSVAYVGAYLVLGRVLGGRLDKLTVFAESMKTVAAAFALLATLAIVAWRIQQRRRFHHDMRMARITPREVRDLIERGEKPYIVDLRHALDMLPDPRVIPGAVRMNPDELSTRHDEIPRDREIILYCT